MHYYAMQFIEGRTLADVIRELRQLEGRDRAARQGRQARGRRPSLAASALATGA